MANIAVKTVFKMHDTNGDGLISREDFTLYGERMRKALEDYGSNPVEAYFAYAGICFISDVIGLTKDAKDGGKALDAIEFEKVRHQAATEGELPFANRVFHTALFRALDTNRSGFIERSEWANYLKIRGTLVSEEKALESFDSIDKNKDGKLSINEFVEFSVDFWCNLGKKLNAENLYGTL